MKPLTGKVAIVTGASSGIGQGIALRLAKDGAKVVINYHQSERGAQATADAIEREAGHSIIVQCDVSKASDTERLFQVCIEKFGKPDILVNNAGRGTLQPLSEVTEELFDQVFGLNAKGTLLCLKQAALHLNTGGRVVNIASSTAVYPWPGAAIYASSKAAVMKMTDIAAMELKARQITVNSVIPGITQTPMTADLPKDAVQPVADASLLGRLGLPSDIAAVVAFFAGADGAWVTGQHVVANGGSGH